jgi:hypothetical protein
MTEYLFDPGYSQHLVSLIFSLEDMYEDIAKFKNLGQKKFRFKQYYSGIIKLLRQNTAFYLGCLLWAVYLVNQEEGNIINNYCLGKDYDEEKSLIELDFLIKFTKTFNKDTKYYMNTDFKFPEEDSTMLEIYREFAVMNEGFVNIKKTTDLKLPKQIKTPSKEDLNTIKTTIDKVITTGDFDLLFEHRGIIL